MDLDSLTAIELGQLLGVSDRAIRDMGEAGMPFSQVKGKVYRYQWRACHTWWLANRYKGSVAQPRGSRVPSKADSEARLLDVKARREEIKLARDEGRLVPVEEIEPTWLRVAETVKNRVLTLPPKAKEELPHLSTDDVKVLHRLCREALEELSQCPAASKR